ncbi:MAG TPA: Fic family protein, partial [Desulfobulbus sp.]|nr:Fic family protein [Desulfobulbus sp.]
AVVETAESGKKTFRRILALRQELDAEILKLGRRAENGQRLILYLYGTPTITVNKTMELLAIKYVPANRLIATLVDMGILQEITGFQRNRIFLLRRYIDIFRNEN